MPPRLRNSILPKFSHPCYNAQERGPPYSTKITLLKIHQKSFSAKFLSLTSQFIVLLPLGLILAKSVLSLSRISSAAPPKTSAGSAPATHSGASVALALPAHATHLAASGALALSAPATHCLWTSGASALFAHKHVLALSGHALFGHKFTAGAFGCGFFLLHPWFLWPLLGLLGGLFYLSLHLFVGLVQLSENYAHFFPVVLAVSFVEGIQDSAKRRFYRLWLLLFLCLWLFLPDRSISRTFAVLLGE